MDPGNRPSVGKNSALLREIGSSRTSMPRQGVSLVRIPCSRLKRKPPLRARVALSHRRSTSVLTEKARTYKDSAKLLWFMMFRKTCSCNQHVVQLPIHLLDFCLGNQVCHGRTCFTSNHSTTFNHKAFARGAKVRVLCRLLKEVL